MAGADLHCDIGQISVRDFVAVCSTQREIYRDCQFVGGQIKVLKPKAIGAPVNLALDLSPRDDGSVLARATLQDARSSPLVDVPVAFVLHTSVGGELVLGTPMTIGDGSAVVKIPGSVKRL